MFFILNTAFQIKMKPCTSVLVTPFSTDWDDDGDEDLVCGNSAGYIGFIENLDRMSEKWSGSNEISG
jgi:hypothetical protein